jgi:hypothetical protein
VNACSHCQQPTDKEILAESLKLCGTLTCEDCRDYCEDCSLPAKADELDTGEDKHGVRCCSDCSDTRDEDDQCQCPGGEQLGPCHCPACRGGR